MSRIYRKRRAARAALVMLCSLLSFGAAWAQDSQIGLASFYWQPQRTASGERFNPGDLTAAHNKLPFGTHVAVRNRRTNKEVVVRINDRGPYVKGRVIDLSRAAAARLGMRGVEAVSLRVSPKQ